MSSNLRSGTLRTKILVRNVELIHGHSLACSASGPGICEDRMDFFDILSELSLKVGLQNKLNCSTNVVDAIGTFSHASSEAPILLPSQSLRIQDAAMHLGYRPFDFQQSDPFFRQIHLVSWAWALGFRPVEYFLSLLDNLVELMKPCCPLEMDVVDQSKSYGGAKGRVAKTTIGDQGQGPK